MCPNSITESTACGQPTTHNLQSSRPSQPPRALDVTTGPERCLPHRPLPGASGAGVSSLQCSNSQLHLLLLRRYLPLSRAWKTQHILGCVSMCGGQPAIAMPTAAHSSGLPLWNKDLSSCSVLPEFPGAPGCY